MKVLHKAYDVLSSYIEGSGPWWRGTEFFLHWCVCIHQLWWWTNTTLDLRVVFFFLKICNVVLRAHRVVAFQKTPTPALWGSHKHLLSVPDHGVTLKATKRPSPECKSKEPLNLFKFKLELTMCLMYWRIGEPWPQLGWDLYNSRVWGEGFLRFRTPDELTFV